MSRLYNKVNPHFIKYFKFINYNYDNRFYPSSYCLYSLLFSTLFLQLFILFFFHHLFYYLFPHIIQTHNPHTHNSPTHNPQSTHTHTHTHIYKYTHKHTDTIPTQTQSTHTLCHVTSPGPSGPTSLSATAISASTAVKVDELN